MAHALTIALGLLALLAPTRADDTLTPEIVDVVKAATVYVRVEGDGWGASGSGFVVASDKDRVLVVTNHHVAGKIPPGAKPKPPTLTVVFSSGTKAEREYPATIVASDVDRDLAVLRVAGVKDAPKAVSYADPPKPFETMALFSFGFPLGQALSVGKGFPAVTVGKASVSSLREGDDGELAIIQIDGNLNPGNSGGPVVDAKGRLVGVAVARARNGQGIGFLIPAAEVGRLVAGRIGRVRVVAAKGADGKPIARVEAELLDPAEAVRGATAYYVVVPPKGKAPDAASLEKHQDARRVTLKVDNGKAVGEFALDKVDGLVVVQVVGDRGPGAGATATRARAFPLAPAAKPEDLAGSPPAGWKEFGPAGKAFVVWLPEKSARQVEEERATTLMKQAVPANGITGKTEDGLTYRVETMDLPPAVGRIAVRIHAAYRDALHEETKGRITDSGEVQTGSLYGVYYKMESGAEVTRVRMYLQGGRVYAVRVVGTADQVASAEAETILVSFRRPGEVVAKAPDLAPAAEPTVVVGGKEPTILGSREFHPRFKTVGPEGAVVIGLEARFEKFGDTDIVRGVRPIFRVGGKEEFGTPTGADLKGAVTLKAKDGYAVGGITGKAGHCCHGFSLTFMRVKADGTLDTKDSYESEWAGFRGAMDVTKVTSDGAPVVGIVGRIAHSETYALGLLYKGQSFEVDPGAPNAEPKLVPSDKGPTIFGMDTNHPKFRVVGPDGATLIGLEVRVGKFGPADIVCAVRPIYRVNGKEEFGKQAGDNLKGAVTLKAKDGYAVGGITAKYGGWCNGFSLTYMKVKADGTLDPKDAYDSDWVGSSGKGEGVGRAVSAGPPAVGVVGRIAANETYSLGLVFKGQEGLEANTAAIAPAAVSVAEPKAAAVPKTVVEPKAVAVPKAVAEPKAVAAGKDPYIFGSIEHDPKFKTVGPDGAVLIGVEVRFGKFGTTDIARAVRPIYRVGGKEEFGKQFGDNLTGSVTMRAKDGYAVGGMTGKAGWWCNGFSLTFMKVKPDGTLDPKDSYEGEWAGFNGKGDAVKILSDGTPVVGIVGKIVGTETTAVGLLFKGQEGFEVNPRATPAPKGGNEPKAVAVGKDPAIVAGGSAPKFKDVAPGEGVLVGLELGLGKFGTEDVIKAARPIYRVGDEEKFGEQRGTQLGRVTVVKAKAGYAVGAITYKFGLNFDGCSVTFMKLANGKLDPKDTYESEWVGWNGNKQPSKVASDGRPVVGVVGKANARDLTGLGLVFKGQEAFDPDAKP